MEYTPPLTTLLGNIESRWWVNECNVDLSVAGCDTVVQMVLVQAINQWCLLHWAPRSSHLQSMVSTTVCRLVNHC